MNYSIRELKRDENKILDTFLYEAIFIPEGVPVPSKLRMRLLVLDGFGLCMITGI